jgi:hypothetical protein
MASKKLAHQLSNVFRLIVGRNDYPNLTGQVHDTAPFSVASRSDFNHQAFQFLYRFPFPSVHCGLAYAQFVGNFLLC